MSIVSGVRRATVLAAWLLLAGGAAARSPAPAGCCGDCGDCGGVQSIRCVEEQGKSSGVGAVGGGGKRLALVAN